MIYRAIHYYLRQILAERGGGKKEEEAQNYSNNRC
jgi:hypothetical protein